MRAGNRRFIAADDYGKKDLENAVREEGFEKEKR
jgi:hypothetical protein